MRTFVSYANLGSCRARQVCEVHRLHRETFYLAVDFLDRYLSRARDLPKSQLQLGGEILKGPIRRTLNCESCFVCFHLQL